MTSISTSLPLSNPLVNNFKVKIKKKQKLDPNSKTFKQEKKKRQSELNRISKFEKTVFVVLKKRGVQKVKRNHCVVIRQSYTRFVDLVIFDSRLFIEIDGDEHNPEFDSYREKEILSEKSFKNYKFLRYKNSQIKNDLNYVISDIIYNHLQRQGVLTSGLVNKRIKKLKPAKYKGNNKFYGKKFKYEKGFNGEYRNKSSKFVIVSKGYGF